MTMLSSALAERGDSPNAREQITIESMNLRISVALAVQGSKFNV
jgi:hypothetical protein